MGRPKKEVTEVSEQAARKAAIIAAQPDEPVDMEALAQSKNAERLAAEQVMKDTGMM